MGVSSRMSTEMQSDADRLDDYIHRHGPVKGRIAMAIDKLVDADSVIGRHRVYNRTGQPGGKPWEDLADARRTLADVRTFLQEALLHN